VIQYWKITTKKMPKINIKTKDIVFKWMLNNRLFLLKINKTYRWFSSRLRYRYHGTDAYFKGIAEEPEAIGFM
jgi:hypothetical protein